MKLDMKIARLICELEYNIGSECYNPNSYDGYTGEEGKEFRYPVYIRGKKSDKELTKISGNIHDRFPRVSPDAIGTMKYKFGSNHLYVGYGIYNILEALEDRYGIDFNELENNRVKK